MSELTAEQLLQKWTGLLEFVLKARDATNTPDDCSIGMRNGFELIASIMENREPNFYKKADYPPKPEPVLMQMNKDGTVSVAEYNKHNHSK